MDALTFQGSPDNPVGERPRQDCLGYISVPTLSPIGIRKESFLDNPVGVSSTESGSLNLLAIIKQESRVQSLAIAPAHSNHIFEYVIFLLGVYISDDQPLFSSGASSLRRNLVSKLAPFAKPLRPLR